MSDQIWWYVTRSSSIVAWFAAALSILIGLLTSSRLLGRRPTIPWLTDFHRSLSGISVIFVFIHMGSLWLDGFVDFGPAELLVPWVAEVPGLSRTGIAFGVIAAWFLFAVEATSLVKDQLSKEAWYQIHLSSYLVLGLGTYHALRIGSDITNPIVVSLGISILTAILIGTGIRVRRMQRDGPPTAVEASPAATLIHDPDATQPIPRPVLPPPLADPVEPMAPLPPATGPSRLPPPPVRPKRIPPPTAER